MAISMHMYVHKIFQAKNDFHAKKLQKLQIAKRIAARKLRCRRLAEQRRFTMMMNRKNKNLACSRCRHTFKSKQSLNRHVCRPIKNGALYKPFLCDSCSKSYSSFAYLKNHTCNQHLKNSQKRPYTCSHCSKVFKHEQTFTLHVEKEHEHEVSQCASCQDGERLKKPSYGCHQCGKKFKAELTLKQHTVQEHSLPSSSQVKLHIKQDHHPLPSSSQAKMHIKQDHHPLPSSSQAKLHIKQDHHSLPSSSQAKLHIKQDHHPLPSSSQAMRHIKQNHLLQSSSESEVYDEQDHSLPSSFACAACGASFDNIFALRQHLDRVHLSLFVCDVCGEGHPSEKSLNIHHSIIHRRRT